MEELPIGIYSSAPTLHLSVLARCDGFTVQDLDEALYEHRSLVRMQAMRRSAFVIPTSLVPLVYQANRAKHVRELDHFLAQAKVTPAMYQATARRVQSRLAHGPMTSGELKKALAPLEKPVAAMFSDILRRMAADALIVRGRVRGSWRSLMAEYHLYQDWLPDLALDSIEPAQAQIDLARVYFASYGPSTQADFQWWTHWPLEETAAALDALVPELRTVQVDGLEGDLMILEKDLASLATSSPEPDHRIDLLPAWDAYLMGYTRRERYLSPELAPFVIDRSGNVAATILLDGELAGVWDTEESKEAFTFKAAFFGEPPKAAWRALVVEAERLLRALHPQAAPPLAVLDCSPPPSLEGASQNRFQFPLRDAPGKPIRI